MNLNLIEISKQRSRELQAQHQQALDDVKGPLREAAEYARREIPKIEAAMARAVLWKRNNVDCLDWVALGGMPKGLSDKLFEIEKLGKTPGALTEMLKAFDALTWQQCWGKRKDGERDSLAPANVRGSFNFLIARGAAHAIDAILIRLKSDLAAIEDRLAGQGAASASLVVAPKKPARAVQVLTNQGND